MTTVQYLKEEWLAEGRAEALAEGRAEGRAEGSYIGRLQLLQEMMGLPVASDETLSRLVVDELEARYVALYREYKLQLKKA